jgi:DNA repair protein RecN (Recombination protein N)
VHEAYILALDSFRKEQSRLRDFRSSVRDREQRLDLLRFQVREIEQVNPQVGEFDALEAELHRLQHAEKLADGVFAALNSAVDAEFNASDLLAASENSLQNLVRWDDSLTSIVEKIHSAQVELQDAIQSLRTYAESLDAEPGRAEEAADRLDAMKRLRRKYGEDETMIRDFLQDAREQLERLEDFEATEEAVAKAERAARKLLVQGAESLTQIRNAYAGTFAELVATQLRELGMERARFAVKRNPKEPDETGADEIRFLFSANAGEELKPLNKIASGGEMSRVMLALKTALAGRAGVPTLIFDEIDAGLGGRAAAIVGRKLTEVAQHTQVMVISHSPQIASCATAHFRIEKVESDGRVITQVNGLTDQARELEIARMLAGEQVTDSALNNARELLAHPA